MMTTSIRPPIQTTGRSHEKLLRRANEEVYSTEYWTTHGSGPRRILASQSRRREHAAVADGPQKSQSVPDLFDQHQHQENHDVAKENMALQERCLVYESVIATLQTEQISNKFKTADVLSNLQDEMVELNHQKYALMEECRQLQERIIAMKG